jgi:hypothetical protein
VSQQRNKLAHWGVSEYSAAMPGRRLALVPLAMTIENFRARMVGLPEPHRKDHEHAGTPPAISKLRREILNALVRILEPARPKTDGGLAPAGAATVRLDT